MSSACRARPSSETATDSNAALTSARAASVSAGAGSSAGGRTGGATCTTGPWAVPGLTPMPCLVCVAVTALTPRRGRGRGARRGRRGPASAFSPSAVRTTSSPCLAPRAITPRMLVASTASSPGRPISTSRPDSLACSTKRAAGRACRPTDEAMVTVRCAMAGAPWWCGGWSDGGGGVDLRRGRTSRDFRATTMAVMTRTPTARASEEEQEVADAAAAPRSRRAGPAASHRRASRGHR